MKHYSKLYIKRTLGATALCLVTAAAATAQTSLCTFEKPSAEEYKSISVYDPFATSPFNSGDLKANIVVTRNNVATEGDSTQNVLAIQRSRYGSNMFGVKIELAQPIALSPTYKYVHVFLRKPLKSRTMLIGLGKRDDRPGESNDVVQFNIVNNTAMKVNEWYDAVFSIKGNAAIKLYSLVIVPDAESRHDMTEDFAAYIDNISVSDNSAPLYVTGDYPVNFDPTSKMTRTDRYLSSVQLTGSRSGSTTLSTGNVSGNSLAYVKLLDKPIPVLAGETLTPKVNYTGGWMHAYAYVDYDMDGRFSATMADSVPAKGSDLKSFSCYSASGADNTFYNSLGAVADKGAGVADALPTFTLPTTLEPGFYRMRYKVDWNSVDPGGCMDTGNDMIKNGGCIADVILNVHTAKSAVSVQSRNGEVLTADSTTLDGTTTTFGKALDILMVPAPKFRQNGITIYHGCLNRDSLEFGNVQWKSVYYPSYTIRNNRLTIPAELIDGDVRIVAEYAEASGDEAQGDYPLNFDPEQLVLTKTTTHINNISITGGTSRFTNYPSTTSPIKVYQNLENIPAILFAQAGQTLTPSISFTGSSMDAYLYIDYDMDGQFSTGISPSTHTPVAGGELVSYSNVDGFNSLGVANANHNWALPQFTLPADLPRGVYRARLKIDYDCIDPAGRYGSAYTDKLIQDNGGCIIDFFVNVTDGERPVKLHMTDVNIYKGGNNPMPVSILPGSVALIPFITPVKQGYVVDKVIVRHGYNFDGPRVIHGNPQWTADSLLDLSTDGIYRYRLAINKVDGDVEITASAHNVYSPYRKILEEEFATTGEPSSKTWKRCTRYSSTWNRFLSNSKDVCYQADGELVLKAIPNPDKTTDKVDMLTGGIESSGKFTFQHGYLECRAKANPFAGNFPAIWMMPADGSAGWPACGEIDIMEQIDAADKAYHTVHSNWTWTLGHKTDPQSSFNETVDMSYYHTYGLEKQADTIRWYVDGVQVGQYCHVPADDASKQWPYDKAFYIILNQSVGDGSWAAKPDVTHSYQFNIDWLRVYEYRITDDIRSVNSTNKALGIETQRNTLILHAAEPCNVNVNDLAGRHIASLSVSDTSSLRLPAGIYLVNNRKVLVP